MYTNLHILQQMMLDLLPYHDQLYLQFVKDSLLYRNHLKALNLNIFPVFDTECNGEETDQEKLQRHQNPSSTSLSSPSLCGHKGPQREEPQE